MSMPALAQRGRDGAQDAGPVGHHQAQEIGHGSSGVVLEVRADLRRSWTSCSLSRRVRGIQPGPT